MIDSFVVEDVRAAVRASGAPARASGLSSASQWRSDVTAIMTVATIVLCGRCHFPPRALVYVILLHGTPHDLHSRRCAWLLGSRCDTSSICRTSVRDAANPSSPSMGEPRHQLKRGRYPPRSANAGVKPLSSGIHAD